MKEGETKEKSVGERESRGMRSRGRSKKLSKGRKRSYEEIISLGVGVMGKQIKPQPDTHPSFPFMVE